MTLDKVQTKEAVGKKFLFLEDYQKLRIIPLNIFPKDVFLARYNSTGNHHGPEQTFYEPYVTLTDGSWTRPYFDCGGGNIWMVTFSVPIFGHSPTSNISSVFQETQYQTVYVI